ncbi:hypothetical protein K1X76_12645, partial [bacterium]|nr:hypothetical protein [bacterium]
MYNIIGFYKFFSSFDTNQKPWFVEKLKEYNLLGTIILAPEGINATLQGDEKNLQLFIAALQQKPGFEDMFIKYAFNEKPIFKKQVVHVRKEIVTLKRLDINPTTKTAHHLNAKDRNKLL